MRWFLISLGFLIISWIFFVASFGFASQAQAETWACSYKFESMENAKTQIFIREGETFRSIVPAGDTYTYKIVGERDFSIHLINQRMMVVWLWLPYTRRVKSGTIVSLALWHRGG